MVTLIFSFNFVLIAAILSESYSILIWRSAATDTRYLCVIDLALDVIQCLTVAQRRGRIPGIYLWFPTQPHH